ncbi:efflux RND transporter periplasmic adaptor subunit [Galbibacter pacificus]|uniref:Efflux RND transporter periplasmic adaptor subunit n=1 Tax=Galbibacter pacificus TaxID=2996052 RepID=A0ABT6FQ40_9FLAO|nr:efflux RND transporter periplasmic adaptor subunit [Galbibacter pacificus]MDG3582146.1 efflux RND transporter periplasmic adaptor subunit [Galbibacter pacificus]MDG3585378.1 efflux RND transporter periplasmic adaptor subunit [Galbibacter pacificus]
MSRKKVVFICLGILLVAIVFTAIIFATEPTAKSEAAVKETAMLVHVVEVEKGSFKPKIVVTGTVRPVEDVIISPLVSGQVIKRDPKFAPGGFIKKGAVLLQIDPADYKNTLELRKSELLQAKTNLEIEMGRQVIAQQDLQLIEGDTLSQDQQDLVLRKPQLNAVKATVISAQAAVDQAQLNLERSTLRAPFDAHIINQNATVGSQVAPGDNLGRLVGTAHYWVEVTVPLGKLKWLSFPSSEEENGAMVKIRNITAWDEDEHRIGYLDKQVGALDNQTRLARVLVRVPDPLAYKMPEDNNQKLIIGSFVEAQIEGKTVQNVARVDRDYIRNNNTVWVMEDGKLVIKDVSIVLTDVEHAYIDSGIEDNAKVVTTNLSTVATGIPLRTETDSTQTTKNKQEVKE